MRLRINRLASRVGSAIETLNHRKILYPKRKIKGRALLAYLSPITLKHKSIFHTNIQEYNALVEMFLFQGYELHLLATDFLPSKLLMPKHFDIILDIHNFNNWTVDFGISSTKFCLYSTGMHPSYSNNVITTRVRHAFVTYGAEIAPSRFIIKSHSWTGVTDFAYCGSTNQLESYMPVINNIPKHKIWLSSIHPTYVVDPCANTHNPSFVYIGSHGFLLKGLDVLLNVFAKHPEWTLHVFSPSCHEMGVMELYKNIFNNGPNNIVMHGLVNLDSQLAQEILNKAIAIVYPSLSDACATAVINAAVRGCIPIVTNEAGVPQLGTTIYTIPDVHSIELACNKLLNYSNEDLNAMKLQTHDAFRKAFTLERFLDSFSFLFS